MDLSSSVLDAFFSAYENSLLCDFAIHSSSDHFKCHFALVHGFFRHLSDKISIEDECYIIPNFISTDNILISKIISTLYAQPLQITSNNVFCISKIADFLGFCELSFFTQCFKVNTSHVFKLELNDISRILFQGCFDLTIVYKGEFFLGHCFVFASVSAFFREIIDNNSSSIDLSNYFEIDPKFLINFFAIFYSGNVDFSMKFLYEYYFLSSFFQLNDLSNSIIDLLNQSKPHESWLFPALLMADVSNHFSFVQVLKDFLVLIPNINSLDPILLSPRSLFDLRDLRVGEWLLKCLVCSCISEKFKTCWDLNAFSSFLSVFQFSRLGHNNLFEIFDPLLIESDFVPIILKFVLRYFENLGSNFEIFSLLNWISFCIFNCSAEFDLFLSLFFSEFGSSPSGLPVQQVPVEILDQIIQISKDQSKLESIFRSIIRAVFQSQLTFSDFNTLILSLNFDLWNPIFVYSLLLPFSTEIECSLQVNKILVTYVLPRLVSFHLKQHGITENSANLVNKKLKPAPSNGPNSFFHTLSNSNIVVLNGNSTEVCRLTNNQHMIDYCLIEGVEQGRLVFRLSDVWNFQKFSTLIGFDLKDNFVLPNSSSFIGICVGSSGCFFLEENGNVVDMEHEISVGSSVFLSKVGKTVTISLDGSELSCSVPVSFILGLKIESQGTCWTLSLHS
ncbi:hypothetical protein RCL1_006916 [Eukaryota sp. TZLM3-RCL]